MNATSWRHASHTLNADTFCRLIEHRLAAIHLRDFATQAECRRLCDALRHVEVTRNAATTSPMTLIGSNFSNDRGQCKDDYFATVEPAYRDLKKLTDAAGFDPLQRLMSRLAAIWPNAVDVAAEPGFGRYFAGGIKTRVAGSVTHFDYVPRFTPEYRIGEIVDQLSWNLYLEMPKNTGSTTIYDAPVAATRAIQTSKEWNTKLDGDELNGAQTYTFQPEVGEVVLFNTRNPHTVVVDEVAPGEWRAQAGSFIGRLPDNNLILWS